jgi:hypothetical protein
MAAGAWTLVNGASKLLQDGTLNPDGDTFKMSLHTSAGNVAVTSTTFAALTGEVTNTGYTAGGASCPLTAATVTTNDVKVTQDAAVVWTAGTTDIVAKWGVLYEVGGNVLAFCLLEAGGANVTATIGNTFTVGGTAAEIYTIAVP